MNTFTEHELMDLVEDTSFMFPAGDWVDIRPHLPVLYSLARWCTSNRSGIPIPARPPRCLEIGVRQGVSTVAILLAMQRTGGTLISLDVDPVETTVARAIVEARGLSPFWQFHLADSDRFHETLEGDLDFLWIDGDHHDPHPTNDFTHYAPFVNEGGIIAMHDYFVEEHRSDAGAVMRCVEAARASGQYEVCVLPWAYGLVVMRKLWR